jgi:hypothetical protein
MGAEMVYYRPFLPEDRAFCAYCDTELMHKVFTHNDKDYCREMCALQDVGKDCIKCDDTELELDPQGFCDKCLNQRCGRCGNSIRWADYFGIDRYTWTSDKGHVFEEMSLLCKACAEVAA